VTDLRGGQGEKGRRSWLSRRVLSKIGVAHLQMSIPTQRLLSTELVDLCVIPFLLGSLIGRCATTGKVTLVVYTNTNEEGIGKHDKGDMTIPSNPAPNLILVKPEVFAGLQIFLDMPPFANCSNDLLQRSISRSEH
jgi:hypothetical protein